MKSQFSINSSQHRTIPPLSLGKRAIELRIPKRSISTLQRLGKRCVEFVLLEVVSSNLRPSRAAFFSIPMKQRPIFYSDHLYVYAESQLPNSPTRREIGFTEDEVVDTLAVNYFRRTQDCEYGESFPLEWLLHQLDNLSLCQRILHKASEMSDLIHLDDQFIDCQNSLWASRK